MDFAKVSVTDLRDMARAAGINERGEHGKTSWIATATKAEMMAAMQAHASGVSLKGRSESGEQGEREQGEQGEQGEQREGVKEKLDAETVREALRRIAREEVAKLRDRPRTVVVREKEQREGEEKRESEKLDIGVTHAIFPQVLALLENGLNVMLVGPPGVGKTHMCEQLAKALARDFHADSFTPHTSDWRVSGYKTVTDATFVPTPFYHAMTTGALYLGDEIDKASDGVVGAFNLALSNSHVSFACGLVPKHPAARLVFAGNTAGLGATPMYPDRSVLPADFRDRFVFVDMPVDEKLERSLALNRNPECGAWVDYVQATRKRVERAGLPLAVTPRASMNGATLLAMGWDLERVAQSLLWRGAPDSIVARASGVA